MRAACVQHVYIWYREEARIGLLESLCVEPPQGVGYDCSQLLKRRYAGSLIKRGHKPRGEGDLKEDARAGEHHRHLFNIFKSTFINFLVT